MVCFPVSVPVDHRQNQVDMTKSVNSTDPCPKSRNKRAPNSPNHSRIPLCRRSQSAAVDVFILIAVIGACGFLLFPYIKLLSSNAAQIALGIVHVAGEEVLRAPAIYGCLGLSILCMAAAASAITVCTSGRCRKPGCRGLRKPAEFDIQLESGDCVKNGVKKGFFKLPRDHHRELEAELRKMAPPNGRAVLVFRARCGCSVGKMEVPGLKKPRKVKK